MPEQNKTDSAPAPAFMKRLLAIRSPQDYAIEHAEYLAQVVEAYMKARNDLDVAAEAAHECDGDDEQQDGLDRHVDHLAEVAAEHFNGLSGAVYEFRKRAERAYSPAPSENER